MKLYHISLLSRILVHDTLLIHNILQKNTSFTLLPKHGNPYGYILNRYQ